MEKTKKITTIGGQALIEGIMMVGPKRTTAAFCDEKGRITTEDITAPRLRDKWPILGKPFIRGIFSLVDTFRLGYKALSISADKLTEEDGEEELSGLDKWLYDHLGEKLTGAVMAIGGVLGVALAILLFFFLPTKKITKPAITSTPQNANTHIRFHKSSFTSASVVSADVLSSPVFGASAVLPAPVSCSIESASITTA